MPSLQPSLTDLRGKTLAYIEFNPAATQATLNMLSVTPLVITHSLTLASYLKTNMTFCSLAHQSRSLAVWCSIITQY